MWHKLARSHNVNLRYVFLRYVGMLFVSSMWQTYVSSSTFFSLHFSWQRRRQCVIWYLTVISQNIMAYYTLWANCVLCFFYGQIQVRPMKSPGKKRNLCALISSSWFPSMVSMQCHQLPVQFSSLRLHSFFSLFSHYFYFFPFIPSLCHATTTTIIMIIMWSHLFGNLFDRKRRHMSTWHTVCPYN